MVLTKSESLWFCEVDVQLTSYTGAEFTGVVLSPQSRRQYRGEEGEKSEQIGGMK